MASTDDLGRILRAVGFYSVTLTPMILVYSHLIAAALFPIIIGAHASLVRPPSAAKEIKHKTSDGTEEEAEPRLENLSAADAVIIPLTSGVVLVGLYYLIQYLQDPELLSRILNWYFSAVGISAATSLLRDSFTTITSMAFPSTFSLDGTTWTIMQPQRLAISSSEPARKLISPLPGILSRIPLLGPVSNILWKLRGSIFTRFTVEIYAARIFDVKVRVAPHTLFSAGLAVVLELYFNVIAKPWWLTNLLGFCYSYLALQYISPSTALTGSIILGALFLYDIFFVFFTPVMVTVATELDIPAKLMFPQPSPSGIPEKQRPMSMLGLGDVVLPGIMIAFALRFDLYLHYLRQNLTNSRNGAAIVDKHASLPLLAWSKSKPLYRRATGGWGERFWTSDNESCPGQGGRFAKTYFKAALTGYVVGMLCTLIVLQCYDHPQPALLYLVPGVLGALYVTAYWKGEFNILWDFDESVEDIAAGSKQSKANTDKSARQVQTDSSLLTKFQQSFTKENVNSNKSDKQESLKVSKMLPNQQLHQTGKAEESTGDRESSAKDKSRRLLYFAIALSSADVAEEKALSPEGKDSMLET